MRFEKKTDRAIRIGFAKQSQSDRDGKALRSRAKAAKGIDCAKQSQSDKIKGYYKKKSNPANWIGFAKQSQSITLDSLGRLALRSKANITPNRPYRTVF
jgi:hypothetical protein